MRNESVQVFFSLFGYKLTQFTTGHLPAKDHVGALSSFTLPCDSSVPLPLPCRENHFAEYNFGDFSVRNKGQWDADFLQSSW